MTIDEAIANAREVAEKERKICETHIFFDNVTYEEFYADDTEIIEKALKEHKLCAEEHEQLAEWLECFNEIAHIFLEHRNFGEYPSSVDDMWEETIRALDRHKIQLKEQKNE